jgi:extracellular elastinolytic metalloproteinase
MIPEDYHALYDRGVQAARSAEAERATEETTAGRERLVAEVSEVVINQDETTGLPIRSPASSRPHGCRRRQPRPRTPPASSCKGGLVYGT